MTALVKIVIEHQEDVLKVPLAALRFQPHGAKPAEDPGRHGVWVQTSSGALQRVPVIVGTAGAEQVALKGGELIEGSQVVIGQAIRPAGMELLGIRFGS
jgi:HlyD family secretion protein